MSIFASLVDKNGKRKYPSGWEELFESNWHLLEKVDEVIRKKGTEFYPKSKEVFKAYELLQPKDIKVIILGQDPYHSTNNDDEPVAVGLSFSVRKGSPIAPSLKNIFKVIEQNMKKESQCRKTGDLTPWVEQGVFLLNTCLTVEPGKPESHGDIWKGFILRTLDFIFKHTYEVPLAETDLSDEEEEDEDEVEKDESKTKTFTIDNSKKIAYPIALLWGKKAQVYEKNCKGVVLKSSHPSPFSFTKGFNECDHFILTNKLLKARKIKPITW